MGPEDGFLNSGHVPSIALGGLAAVTTFLLLSLLAFLCTSCDGDKKPKHQNGDHENLMNVPSDKETFSHSVTSLATDAPPSIYQNGGISNGDVISEDSTTACIEPYEEVQPSCPDLCDPQDSLGKSIKHAQTRELPSIPPGTNIDPAMPVIADVCLVTEGPYEVLNNSISQDNIIDDCLYETVNEIKESGVTVGTDPSKTLDVLPTVKDGAQNDDHSPECRSESAEYASVDRNRKSQHCVGAERAYIFTLHKEDEAPPPVPEKLLDENENVHGNDAGPMQPAEEAEGPSRTHKMNSSLSYKSLKDESCLQEDDIASMYSTVSKPGQSIIIQDELANYAHIQDIATRRSPSIGSELYATARDFEKSPNLIGTYEESDSEYEALPSMVKDEDRTVPVPNDLHTALPLGESDYESIGDLNQNGDLTRL